MARLHLSVLAYLLGWSLPLKRPWPWIRGTCFALLSGSQVRWEMPEGEEWEGALVLWHPWGWLRCALELAEGQAVRMAIVAWRVGAGGHCRLARVQLTQGSPVVVTLRMCSTSSMCRAQPCRQLICTFFISKAQKCVECKPFAVLPA